MSKTFIESQHEMEKILSEERLGYLGLSTQGRTYIVPLNYAYVEGRIIFHCAQNGMKLDYIRENPKVCFSVARQFGKIVKHPQGAVCHADSDSVICYGIARIIDNIEERKQILNEFNHCLQKNATDIQIDDVKNCNAVEIKLIEMTGRVERDNKCTFWIHRY
jgi:nitroimidazol reductase NimA-like FMN-containing flavoprotein (pyridoxamine 5'-phosphate oxidase superfamily)